MGEDGLAEVVEDGTFLRPQCPDDGENALDESAAGFALVVRPPSAPSAVYRDAGVPAADRSKADEMSSTSFA